MYVDFWKEINEEIKDSRIPEDSVRGWEKKLDNLKHDNLKRQRTAAYPVKQMVGNMQTAHEQNTWHEVHMHLMKTENTEFTKATSTIPTM